jgi:hypothetical protein
MDKPKSPLGMYSLQHENTVIKSIVESALDRLKAYRESVAKQQLSQETVESKILEAPVQVAPNPVPEVAVAPPAEPVAVVTVETKQPVESVEVKQPAESVAAKQPAESVEVKQPAEPAAVQKPEPIVAEQQPVIAKPPDPVASEQEPKPVQEEKKKVDFAAFNFIRSGKITVPKKAK